METKYNPQKQHRRSIRLKGYDYSQAGLYFITLCCQNRTCFFGDINDGKMILNFAGEIIEEEWQKTIEIRKNIALHDYIIMPNHFHAIIEILFPKIMNELQSDTTKSSTTAFKSPSQTIGAIIRGFKGACTKRINEKYLEQN